MRNSYLALLGLAAVGVAAAGSSLAQDATSPAPSPVPAETPQLVGRWKLNPDKSDDARAKMRDAMAARRRQNSGGDSGGSSGGSGGGYGGGGHMGGGHMGGGGMGGGGHMGGGMGGGHRSGGSGGSQQSDDKRAAMRASMDDVLEPGDVLTITQKNPDVTVTADDGRVRNYFADGRKVKGKDGAPEQTAKWDGGKLDVMSKIDSGPTIHQTYSLDPDGKALQLTARILMPNSETPVIIHRQYDLTPSE